MYLQQGYMLIGGLNLFGLVREDGRENYFWVLEGDGGGIYACIKEQRVQSLEIMGGAI